MEPYTVALTSCGRFDLLERTLHSLLPRLVGPVADILIIEDSGDERILDIVRPFGDTHGKIEVIVNNPPLGQIKSLDRLYSSIETEWIFHCEDDWEFYADDFLERSFTILEEFDHFSMVSVRDGTECAYLLNPAPQSYADAQYFTIDQTCNPVWAGFSFNPGLRRMRDYRFVKPYADIAVPGVTDEEQELSKLYRKLGYSLVHLAEPAVRHIGDGRSAHNRASPPSIVKCSRLIRKRWHWLGQRLNPSTDPVFRSRQRMKQAGLALRPLEDCSR